MCLLVFTEIPEALTFTPFSLSLEYGEKVKGAKMTKQARFFGFVESVGNQIHSINCAPDHGDEENKTLQRDEEP